MVSWLHLFDTPFEPSDMLEKWTKAHDKSSIGAVSSFTGKMRAYNKKNEKLNKMTIQHYPPMTEKKLKAILQQSEKNWLLEGAMIIHRYGDIFPGEPIVLTAAAATHRHDAFEACRFLIDQLKTDAPFWKCEETINQECYWVEQGRRVEREEQ